MLFDLVNVGKLSKKEMVLSFPIFPHLYFSLYLINIIKEREIINMNTSKNRNVHKCLEIIFFRQIVLTNIIRTLIKELKIKN